MVGNREGAGEDGAGLTVLALAVAEEQRVGSGVIVPELAGLAYEAAREGDSVLDGGSAADDEVVTDHSDADMDGGGGVAVDAAVLQARSTLDLAAVADPDVLDIAGVDDGDSLADGTDGGLDGVDVSPDEPAHPLDELGTMPVKGHYVCLLGGEPVVDHDFAAAGLVEDRDFHSVAERGLAVAEDDIDIFDESIGADAIIGNIIVNPLYAAVVADFDIVKRNMVQTGVLLHASGEGKLPLEGSQADVA